MSEERLFKDMKLVDNALYRYKVKKDPSRLLALIYSDPVYEDDLVPGIVEYFEKKFDEMKKEYKSMP